MSSSLKVCDLLCPVSKDWNIDMIRHHVPQYEDVIRRIITSSMSLDDTLVWLPEKSGIYSAKSGYNLAKVASLPRSPTPFNWQKSLWNLSVSPKLKTFLWKAANGALAVGANLALRGLGTNTTCKRCGGKEDEGHLFLMCPYAARVWDLVPGLHKPSEYDFVSILQLLSTSSKMVNLPPTCLSSPLYPWLMWNLWKARNLFVFEDRSFSEAETVLKAIKDAKEWQDAQKVSQPQVKLPKVFQPPAPISEKFSCFVDAAWNGISGACGLGWCLKDSSDLTSRTFSSQRTFVSSALVAEALALRSALSMASSLPDVEWLAVFSDSQILISLINSKSCLTELRSILHDIVCISSSFKSISFAYVARRFNSVDDGLAKSALLALNSLSIVGV